MGDSLLALAKSIYYELVWPDSLMKVKKQNGNNSLCTYLRLTSE